MAAESRRIQSTSCQASWSISPAEPSGASSKTPVPASASARPDAEQLVLGGKGSRDELPVDGPVAQGAARWRTPRAPARSASRTMSRMASMSAALAGSFLAPRSPMT